MFIRVLLAFLLSCSGALARGGGGGHLTTFDNNLFAGYIHSCFMSAASGKCPVSTTHYFNAVCDGVTDDSTPFAAVATYGIANNPTPLLDVVPFGVTCNIPNAAAFGGQVNQNYNTTAGITNFAEWSYGATFLGPQEFNMGTDGILCTCTIGSATSLIQSANAGDTSVTLIATPLSLFNIALTNSNLTATSSANKSGSSNPTNTQQAFSTASNLSGKFYVEATINAFTDISGNATATFGFSDQIKFSSVYIDDTGNVSTFYNNSTHFQFGLGALSAGNVIDWAIDLGAKQAWVRVQNGNWNGSMSANPATGTGGFDISNLTFPLWSAVVMNANADQWTVKFTGPYTNAAPSGFNDWTGSLSSTLPGPIITPNVTRININSCSVQIESSNPPNWCNQEYKVVTAVNDSVLTLSSPLLNSYLSTTPSMLIQGINDFQTDQAGPANIQVMGGSWAVNQQYYGGTWISGDTTGNGRVLSIGMNIAVYDAVIYGWSASSGISISLFNSSIQGSEVDKNITNLMLSNVQCHNNILFQSPSPTKFLGYNLACNMDGTPPDISLYGGVGVVDVGPTSFGITKSLYVDGFKVTAAKSDPCGPCIHISSLSFSAGVLSIANNAADFATLMQGLQIPGSKWYFADTDGSDDSNPESHFTVSAATQDGTNTYIHMSNCSWGVCTGALPTPSCGSNPSCTYFAPFGALSVTQINKPAGSVDLTQFQAP